MIPNKAALLSRIFLCRGFSPFGFDWENKVPSLEVGPEANLTLYDNCDFQDQVKSIDAKTNAPEMSKQMGFF
ncbi:beta/gamma crystallin [Nitrosospira sp. Nsp2]|nr:beta/gamma crystallin domain-containing protein [Nitrosospira sp. Nsp2]PTR14745.1 beta/gamma crystallin [Nitrosospira sp. Nsp2]